MPCPNCVDIPGVLNFYNKAMIYSDANLLHREYRRTEMFREDQRGDKCIKGEICMDKCPRNYRYRNCRRKHTHS